MTPASLRILAFAAVASLPLMAQQPSPRPQPPSSTPQANPPTQTNPEPGATQTSPGKPSSPGVATPVPSTANSPEVATPQLRPVTGELESKLDTKDAKAGDAIVVKTTSPATMAEGVEIPKGSKIVGHIIDVAPQGQGSENSRVTIQFDQAQVQGGKSMPIRSVIQSVAPPGTSSGPDAAGGPPATTPASGVTAGGNSPSSGSSATTAPGTASPSQPAAGASQARAAPPAPGTVVATRGNLAIKTTSIPGVLLIGDVKGRPFANASGALLGAKQDVRLDNGTVMVVAIMAAPPAPAGAH